jgi:hypothetical protein
MIPAAKDASTAQEFRDRLPQPFFDVLFGGNKKERAHLIQAVMLLGK